MKKLFIKNRKDQKISTLVQESPENKGLAFVMHGLGGIKEADQLVAISEALFGRGFTVIRFDTTNTIGESDGKYEDATTTNYYEDLEDVIDWTKDQDWYVQPFVLVGHSLGAFCSMMYAEKYPESVLALAPLSAVLSGQKTLEVMSREEIEQWKATGWNFKESNTRPGMIMKLKWSHIEDRVKYDICGEIDKLTMPVLLVVGSEDRITPLEHQKEIYQLLPGKKELHVIEGAKHTFRAKEHLDQIKIILLNWIDQLNEV